MNVFYSLIATDNFTHTFAQTITDTRCRIHLEVWSISGKSNFFLGFITKQHDKNNTFLRFEIQTHKMR